ncbi:c-type cytochrome [Pseudobacteriovorax antillogorgiicola]|uniref:Cytochrome C oxidase, cbb3-type, subunit III n=1 Tax=Pseudobacteriovorax antillogorgiicola TaxID=1513793 RepID=A0A1Y6BRP5_9BACT|nr:cytochrome c [Pseudobacteriovorax antillogorgiicola]TCS54689.1 cbb3-type cytochrome c oxidase subunit III [Pseudobacteriovorax antillogorgiicola]SMF16493.1 Cytochrome C oxidase, cbb3-type, subunit III [Pseudobacteriovorax antillogorgiicola]
MKKTLLVMCFLLPTACGLKPRSNDAATVKIQQLQQLDYDKIQFTAVKGGETNPVINRLINGKANSISESLAVGTYTFDLIYLKGADEIAATKFCSEDDQKTRTHNLQAGSNEVRVVVCTTAGEPISADVTIEPVLKDPNDENPSEPAQGAQLYSSQCAGCHGADGNGGAVAGPVKGEQCRVCDTKDNLIQKIEATMPIQDPSSCDQECAESIADFLWGQS